VFRNVSNHPVETMVVFPLPDLDLQPGRTAARWAFPISADDFLGFRLWIDGQPQTPALERRATYQGRDVTAELEATGGIGLLPWKPGAYDDLAAALAPAALDQLKRDGLIQLGDDYNNPQWVLLHRYHWHQTFLPGRDVRVRHVYKPFVAAPYRRGYPSWTARSSTTVRSVPSRPAATATAWTMPRGARWRPCRRATPTSPCRTARPSSNTS